MSAFPSALASCPRSLDPQQSTAPSAARAQVCRRPHRDVREGRREPRDRGRRLDHARTLRGAPPTLRVTSQGRGLPSSVRPRRSSRTCHAARPTARRRGRSRRDAALRARARARAELAVQVAAPTEHTRPPARSTMRARVVDARRDRAHVGELGARSARRDGDAAGRGAAVTELPEVVAPPAAERRVGAHRAGVKARRAQRRDVAQARHGARLARRRGVSATELPEGVVAPTRHGPVAEAGARVTPSDAHLRGQRHAVDARGRRSDAAPPAVDRARGEHGAHAVEPHRELIRGCGEPDVARPRARLDRSVAELPRGVAAPAANLARAAARA